MSPAMLTAPLTLPLQKHIKYMRLTPESTTLTMTREELQKRLDLKDDNKSDEELRQLLIQSERSRCLCMWHDHATILKMGFIMITVHVIYDPVVFYTGKEYEELNPGATVNVQSQIEQLEIYILAAGSSSVEDQAALIGDRLKGLLDLSQAVKTDNGTEITYSSLVTTLLLNLNKGQSRVGYTSVVHVAAKNTCSTTRHMHCSTGGGHYISYKPQSEGSEVGIGGPRDSY